MQIDMHFAGTYLVARIAGFEDSAALTIANAAQYVDDSTKTGFVRFTNDACWERTATAHGMICPENFDDLANHEAWLPFHFLPGNSTSEEYADRFVCQPNTVVSKGVIEACLSSKDRPEGLHRLGITAHVLADTFSHQGFAGMGSKVNFVTDLKCDDPGLDGSIATQVEERFSNLLDRFRGGSLPMLGHGLAAKFPDLPWLNWSYVDGHNVLRKRSNLPDFLAALDQLHMLFSQWLGNLPTALPDEVRNKIGERLGSIRDPAGEVRMKRWIELMDQDVFGIGSTAPNYSAMGWRDQAVGPMAGVAIETTISELASIDFPANFMKSDWKLFHNAAKAHRFDVIERILSPLGLCAA